jgi:hypothetical protein
MFWYPEYGPYVAYFAYAYHQTVSSSAYGTQVGDHSKFLNSDGYKKGGIDVEVTNKSETQYQPVKGQRRMMPDKRKIAKWF